MEGGRRNHSHTIPTGNTSDQDSDREPELPTQTKDKPSVRHGKRDAPKAAPAAPAAATESADTVAARGRGGNRRGGFTGNEAGTELNVCNKT